MTGIARTLAVSVAILAAIATQAAGAATQATGTATQTAGAGAAKTAVASSSQRVFSHHPSRYVAGVMPTSARNYYASLWGVDQLTTQLAESGQLVRFSYRIIDNARAKPLLDKLSNPSLLDERAHAVLSVPVMEKVGPLRQSGAAEAGKTYWVLFSNRGGAVHAGDRVSVVVGSFRVDGLIIEK